MTSIRFLMFIIAVLSATFASAKDVVPFTSKGFAQNYKAVIDGIQNGDDLLLPDGRRYKIEKIAGRGSSTLILDLGTVDSKPLAVRIPLDDGIHPMTRLSYSEMLQSYMNGYGELHKAGITIEAYPELSDPKYYVFVEKVDDHITYKELRKIIFEMPPAERSKYEIALLDFAEKSAVFRSIGDLHGEQLVFDETRNRFVLLDWADLHREFDSVKDPPIFGENRGKLKMPYYRDPEEMKAFVEKLYARIKIGRTRVVQERMKNTVFGKTVDCFVRLWKRVK